MQEQTKIEHAHQTKSWYDKSYKILMLIPVIILVLSLIYLFSFYSKNQSIIYKDVSLSGGTTITLTDVALTTELEARLQQKIPDISIRKLTSLGTGEHLAVVLESSLSPEELTPLIEEVLSFKLTTENSSIEFTGPSLSNDFYTELMKIVLLSFILMAAVIFLIFGESKLMKAISITISFSAVRLTFPGRSSILFLVIAVSIIALIYALRQVKKKKEYLYILIAALILLVVSLKPVYSLIILVSAILLLIYLSQSLPSVAVIFAAFSDVVIALTIVNFMQIKLSAAGLAAFLMLIGYSVDTDILLTSRALQKEGTLNKRIYGAFKTGILMTLTALAAVLPAFFIVTGLPDSFRQIFLILALGLTADIFSTWLTNAGIIKWYCQKRGMS